MGTLEQGAQNVIHQIRLTPQDRLLIITDTQTYHIAEAIKKAAYPITSTHLLRIEDYTSRPAKSLPDELIKQVITFLPTVSIYAAQALENELPAFRRPLLDLLVADQHTRHAHMVNIDEMLMTQGMASDYDQIGTLTSKLHLILKQAQQIKVSSSYGTDLTARVDNKMRMWVPCIGLIDKPGMWTNLPDGEIFTCPETVNGVIAGKVIGDYIGAKYGVLDEPLKVTITDGYIKGIAHTNPSLVSEFTQYVNQSPMNNRVGEFAIGTNIGLTALTGNLLQDEKFPGLHLAFGHSYPDQTGATWDASGHIDLVSPQVSIWIDEQQIMRDGTFLI